MLAVPSEPDAQGPRDRPRQMQKTGTRKLPSIPQPHAGIGSAPPRSSECRAAGRFPLRRENRFRIERLCTLYHVDRDFEQGMLETDRLRPWPLGRSDVDIGELRRALAGESRLERVTRCPPNFAGEPVAARAK